MKLESLKSEKFKKLDPQHMTEIKGGLIQRTGSGSLIGLPGGGTMTASSDTLTWGDNGEGLQFVSFVDAKTGMEISYPM